MPEFAYRALDGRKQFTSGHLQAMSLEAAVEQLLELGYTPLSTVPSHGDQDVGWRRLIPRPTVKPREVTTLLQDLALLLQSGLPLDDGLKLLTDNANSAMASILRQMRKVIGSGGNFGEALEANPATALPDLIAIVKAAEAAGNLEHALRTVAERRAKQDSVTGKVRAAVRYPIFLLVVAISVLVFFLTFVVPQFSDVIRDYGGQPDWTVVTVIAISDFLRQNGQTIMAAIAVLLVAAFIALRMPRVKIVMLSLVFGLPGLRGLVTLRRTANFCRGLSTLLANGVILTDALRLLSEAQKGGGELKSIIDSVRRGGRLVDALEESNFVPELAGRMLRVGEEAGSLDTVAARCADYYETKLTEQIDKLTGIVGPAAIVLISSLIGTLIVSIMSTLLSINQMAM
jgi:general secretion pathway protein F